MPNPNPIPPPEESRFKPGESGNPAGRAAGSKNMSTILKELLDEEIEIDGEKIPFKSAIVKKLVRKANAGNLKAIQEIFDRTEGKAKQEMKIEAIGRGILNIDPIDDTAHDGPAKDSSA
jgi:hypothetical protein